MQNNYQLNRPNKFLSPWLSLYCWLWSVRSNCGTANTSRVQLSNSCSCTNESCLETLLGKYRSTFSTFLEHLREPPVPPNTVCPLVWVILARHSTLTQHQWVITCICQVRQTPVTQRVTVTMEIIISNTTAHTAYTRTQSVPCLRLFSELIGEKWEWCSPEQSSVPSLPSYTHTPL